MKYLLRDIKKFETENSVLVYDESKMIRFNIDISGVNFKLKWHDTSQGQIMKLDISLTPLIARTIKIPGNLMETSTLQFCCD